MVVNDRQPSTFFVLSKGYRSALREHSPQGTKMLKTPSHASAKYSFGDDLVGNRAPCWSCKKRYPPTKTTWRVAY
ncbi:hypothetical protein GBA52_016478 [Prunus armeniaca]|nr:hypothetical protein GBA52_016478 [Prunus armeniaca]